MLHATEPINEAIIRELLGAREAMLRIRILMRQMGEAAGVPVSYCFILLHILIDHLRMINFVLKHKILCIQHIRVLQITHSASCFASSLTLSYHGIADRT